MNRFLILVLLIAAAFLSGCDKPADSAAPTTRLDFADPVQPQPKLPTMKLWVGPEEMNVELALTPEQQRIGMMLRTNLAENAGMFFPLPITQRASFWMKNCPLPLSAAYIDPDGVIQEIHDFQPHNTNAVLSASYNIRFVLETPRGWFERHNVKTGMLIRSERGTLIETFFGRNR